MFGFHVRTRDETHKVKRKAKRANIENLGHAGAALRIAAMRSIRRRKKAAPPGSPPHTQTRRLPRAIKYAVDKQRQNVVIGPDAESVGRVGGVHEHGGRYYRRRYPPRPFMGPALEKIRPRLPRMWAASIR